MDLATKPHPISISMQPNVDIYFNAFPYAIPAVGEMNILEFHPDDAFFVGENGSGKSTILEATRPESSPLSWNSLTITIPVNQHCLFDTFDPARNAVEQRLLVNSEPAPPASSRSMRWLRAPPVSMLFRCKWRLDRSQAFNR